MTAFPDLSSTGFRGLSQRQCRAVSVALLDILELNLPISAFGFHEAIGESGEDPTLVRIRALRERIHGTRQWASDSDARIKEKYGVSV